MDDLTGMTFGNRTVIKRVENNSRGASMWECRCSCGRTSIIPGSHLRTGRASKCYACAARERAPKRKKRERHGCGSRGGMSGTKIYKTWKNMKSRCYYRKNKDFHNYGGRGIKVCDEWKTNFSEFYNYVSKLENFGKEGFTIDRIDVNDDYRPGNVRWATKYEQVHNRRVSKH